MYQKVTGAAIATPAPLFLCYQNGKSSAGSVALNVGFTGCAW